MRNGCWLLCEQEMKELLLSVVFEFSNFKFFASSQVEFHADIDRLSVVFRKPPRAAKE